VEAGFFFGFIFEGVGVFEGVLGGCAFFLVGGDEGGIECGGFGAFIGEVMSAGEEIASVDADLGIFEGGEHSQRASGRDVILEQEAGIAMLIGGLLEESRFGEDGISEEGLDDGEGVFGLCEAEEHFSAVAASAVGPFEIEGEFLGVLGRWCFDESGEGIGGGGEGGGGLSEALVGGGAELLGLVGFGGDLVEGFHAGAAKGQAEVVLGEAAVWEVGDAGDGLEHLDGGGVVFVGAFEEGEGQAIACGCGACGGGEFLKEGAEAFDGDGEVSFVVGGASGVKEEGGGLIGGQLLSEGGHNDRQAQKQGNGQASQATQGQSGIHHSSKSVR